MHSHIEIKDKAKHSTGNKVEAFRKQTRKTNPHKHNSYFELVYLSEGDGFHTIDANSYAIETPVIFVIRQDQLHFWDIITEPDGYVLILKKAFADQFFDHELSYLFSQLTYHPKIALPAAEANTVNQIFTLLVRELKEADHPGITFLSLLKALIAKILDNRPSTGQMNGSGKLYSDFAQHLASQTKWVNSVSHYAGILHTTPQNLTAACKKETGKSASAVLSEHIISEARRLLLYTSLSVSEIAYQLGFKDNSHFSKYFKKNTGQGPSLVRKQN